MTVPQTQRERTSLKQLSAVAQARQIRLQTERQALAQRERALEQAWANQRVDEGLLERSIVVVATSDKSSAERAKAPEVAMACAEYFRDKGQSVLLLMDSVTRYARALREIGLAAGEPPTRRGYPPSVFNALPRLFERAGCSERGVITAFFTVLVDDDAAGDPIFEETRATLDGHILLSPRLADGGHYPAIDVLGSRSRVMQKVAPPAHTAAARTLREMLQKLQDIETLVQIGEYRSGSDLVADRALGLRQELMQFLQQERHDISALNATSQRLLQLAGVVQAGVAQVSPPPSP
jgi:ATP synthase in type III secretion protein N